MKVVVVGGGAAGFSAAMVAKRTGADEVVLIERTDMLGGIALVAGIGMVGSGAYMPLTEERALGGASLYDDVLYPIATHKEVTMPGLDRAMLYNLTKLDARMQRVAKENGISVMLCKTVSDIKMSGDSVKAVILQDKTEISGDAFVDATGTATGIKGCTEFGYGCVGCILRCPYFGNPKGLVDKKVKTLSQLNAHGKPGVLGTSVLVPIASLSEAYQRQLKEKGYVFMSIPEGVEPDMDRAKRAWSYQMPLMGQPLISENLLIVDVGGQVKVTANGSPRYARSLRRFAGLEDSVIASPAVGARGHLVFGLNVVARKNTMEVDGFKNVLCAGTKAGTVAVIDVACSGDLAGYNAVRKARGMQSLELPKALALGAFNSYVGQQIEARTQGGVPKSPLTNVDTLKSLGVYREKNEDIVSEVKKAGLEGIFNRPVS
ncbi:MAG: FAD-dependent oxidoreductase [Chloroflexi bacterium]|nr:FAD-dependent oxidoreductase [Chloroflexota bacterium]